MSWSWWARGRRTSALAALVLVGTAALASCGSSPDPVDGPVERLVIITLPGVTWDDVDAGNLPAVEQLVATSAIGTVSTRIGRGPTVPAAAYLTIGSGTRSVVPRSGAGVVLDADEVVDGTPATTLIERRLGRPVDGIAYLPVGETAEANDASLFRARTGLLGDRLDAAGIRRSVVANADVAHPFPAGGSAGTDGFDRSAAAALMGADGVVPEGRVSPALVTADPLAPSGVVLDPDAVIDAFDDAWRAEGPNVVLVEASDLARAAAAAPAATPDRADDQRSGALTRSNHLVARVLERVDPAADAVLVVSPTARGNLGIALLQAPGVTGGLLTSASTRRDGYLHLADVAPTVLRLMGEEPPSGIEGRPLDVASADGDRVGRLLDEQDGADARERSLPVVATALGLWVALLALVAWRAPGRRRLLQIGSLATIGALAGTFLAAPTVTSPRLDLGPVAVIVAAAIGVAAAGTAADRRWPGSAALVGLGALVGVIGIDVALGGSLQVNTVFGYSMAVAGRFTGLGNLAFAVFASAALCLVVVAHQRWPAAPWLAIGGFLAVVVLIEGFPLLGADVGGTLALVPASIVVLLVLRGRPITGRVLAVAIVAGLAVVVAFGMVDVARPATSQTHLARLGQNVASGRLDLAGATLWRRVEASFGSAVLVWWVIGLAGVALAITWARLRARWADSPPWASILADPADRALAGGLGVLAVVGLVANDSSVAVPATMLLVLVPTLILRRTAQ